MSHYPKMLYRRSRSASDGTVDVHGAPFATRVVNDSDEEAELGARGWAEFGEVANALQPEPVDDDFGDDGASPASADTTVLDGLKQQIADGEKALATARTEIGLANERVATLESEKVEGARQLEAALADVNRLGSENADLKAKIAAFDQDGDGNPGGSKPNDAAPSKAKTEAKRETEKAGE